MLAAIRILLLMATCVTAAWCQNPEPKTRAVSLRVLEATLKKGPSRQASSLCGITRISGYVPDRAGKDIVIFGKVDPGYPALQLDDFVIALRNTSMSYARGEGNTRYYSYPGCSIDPYPAVMRQLQDLKQGPSGDSTDKDGELFIAQWNAIGSKPQQVKVLGIPFDTHFASVMVDADYYMKRLANGSVTLGIPGFKSLMEMRLQQAEKELQAGGRPSLSGPSLNRFWFCPAETTYEEDDGAVLLRDCGIKLLTEEEFLTAQGRVQGMGRPSPQAKEFAESFTTNYQRIAEARPIYRELEGMFRFTALAKLMQDRKAMSTAGIPLQYLAAQHHVAITPVSRQVNGLTAARKLSVERSVPEGKIIHGMLLLSCGGVSIDVHPRKVSAQRTTPTGKSGSGMSKSESGLKKTVLASRTSKDSLYWDIPSLH